MAIDPAKLVRQRLELDAQRLEARRLIAEARLLRARNALRREQVEAVRLGIRRECPGCGEEIGKKATRCRRCHNANWMRANRERDAAGRVVPMREAAHG